MKTPRLTSLIPQRGAGRAGASENGFLRFITAQGQGGKTALGLSAIWVIVAAFLLILFPAPAGETFNGLNLVLSLLAVILPPGLVVIGLMIAEIGRMMAESLQAAQAPAPAPLRAEDALANPGPSYVETAPVVGNVPPPEPVVIDLSEPPPSYNPEPPPEPHSNVPPLSREEMIRAVNFPDSGDDLPGFAALRRALSHPRARTIVQSAQDILTLFSQDGIYMDDLRPELVDPSLWRAYASGVRGEALGGIGVFSDESLVPRLAERLRNDAIFRDAMQHFLRNFDRMFSDFEDGASDEEVAAMSETRSARAFMLAGRAAKIFG